MIPLCSLPVFVYSLPAIKCSLIAAARNSQPLNNIYVGGTPSFLTRLMGGVWVTVGPINARTGFEIRNAAGV